MLCVSILVCPPNFPIFEGHRFSYSRRHSHGDICRNEIGQWTCPYECISNGNNEPYCLSTWGKWPLRECVVSRKFLHRILSIFYQILNWFWKMCNHNYWNCNLLDKSFWHIRWNCPDDYKGTVSSKEECRQAAKSMKELNGTPIKHFADHYMRSSSKPAGCFMDMKEGLGGYIVMFNEEIDPSKINPDPFNYRYHGVCHARQYPPWFYGKFLSISEWYDF